MAEIALVVQPKNFKNPAHGLPAIRHLGLGKIAQGATVIPRATQLLLNVQFALESVSSLPWNHCPDRRGIRRNLLLQRGATR